MLEFDVSESIQEYMELSKEAKQRAWKEWEEKGETIVRILNTDSLFPQGLKPAELKDWYHEGIEGTHPIHDLQELHEWIEKNKPKVKTVEVAHIAILHIRSWYHFFTKENLSVGPIATVIDCHIQLEQFCKFLKNLVIQQAKTTERKADGTAKAGVVALLAFETAEDALGRKLTYKDAHAWLKVNDYGDNIPPNPESFGRSVRQGRKLKKSDADS